MTFITSRFPFFSFETRIVGHQQTQLILSGILIQSRLPGPKSKWMRMELPRPEQTGVVVLFEQLVQQVQTQQNQASCSLVWHLLHGGAGTKRRWEGHPTPLLSLQAS